MVDHIYFSEREGYRAPTSEAIESRFWGGFVDLVKSLLDQGFLAEQFPVNCPDGRGVYECDSDRIGLRFEAEVGLSWPIDPFLIPDTPKVMDAVEFFGRYVSEAKKRSPHSFYGHEHLYDFDAKAGYEKYSIRVNSLFRLCGHPFEFMKGKVERLGPDILHQPLRTIIFCTGDDELDKLLQIARTHFLAVDPLVRKDALEKLWDAFERLKTLENSDKKKGTEIFLKNAVENESIRSEIEKEAFELTKIGNSFRIRHHEVGKIEISSDLDVDYLFYRLFGLIWRLLRGTNRVR